MFLARLIGARASSDRSATIPEQKPAKLAMVPADRRWR
jgi:hypothetical protein